MEFTRDDCKFTIPDRPNVEQQLMYYSAAGGQNTLLRYWLGAQTLIEKWESATLPDYKTDLKQIDSPNVTSLLIWVGLEVSKFMSALDEIPKN